MAHFAQLNEDNIVTQVIVVADEDTRNADGVEQESVGVDFCTKLLGGTWKQTSYNSNIRKNYAGIGFTYDATRDAFIPPKPFESWTLNEDTCNWQAPTPFPDDGKPYIWDEEKGSWVVA